MASLYRVTETMEGRHPVQDTYPLLPGDVISEHADGWTKHAPGLGIVGFQLTQADVAERCEPAPDARWVIG